MGLRFRPVPTSQSNPACAIVITAYHYNLEHHTELVLTHALFLTNITGQHCFNVRVAYCFENRKK